MSLNNPIRNLKFNQNLENEEYAFELNKRNRTDDIHMIVRRQLAFNQLKSILSFFICAFFACSIFFSLSIPASAANYFVATWGDNSNSGTIDSPLQNVSYATQQAMAGDIIYLINGTWNNEHVIFKNSGTIANPIRLIKYNGTVTLNGVDNTGNGIYANGKSYLEISGIEMKNYDTAIKFVRTTSNIVVRDFVLYNMETGGITFEGGVGSTVSYINIYNFTMYDIGLGLRWTGSGIKHEFTFNNSHDFNIYNFTIRDLKTEGISFRNIERLHIYEGNIFNITTGTLDGINFGNSVNNSIIENVTINSTTWHGIGLQENSYPETPLSRLHNNIIRNVNIGFPSHNAIDLHTGNVNMTIENVVLHDMLDFSNGIQQQHAGLNLTIRSAIISGYIVGILITEPYADIYDCTISDVSSTPIQITEHHVTINNCNISDDDTVSILIMGDGNDFIINSTRLGKGKRIDVKENICGIVRDILDSSYQIYNKNGSNTTIEYTDGKVFTLSGGSGSDLSAPVWTIEKSYIFFNVTSDGSLLTITTYPMTARPTTNPATVTVNKFDTSLPQGNILISFTADTTNGNNVVFTVSELQPNHNYLVKKDGADFTTRQANSSGSIQFSNSEWSEHTFTIEETTSKEGLSITEFFPENPTPPQNNGSTYEFTVEVSEPLTSSAWYLDGEPIASGTQSIQHTWISASTHGYLPAHMTSPLPDPMTTAQCHRPGL